jgi:[Skp1-protein]-hydroxyproline N-acetylglucosaminyltransferase
MDREDSDAGDNDINTHHVSRRSPQPLLRGIGCLIFVSVVLFLLSPAPNTHPGGAGGGMLREVPGSVSHGHDDDPRERTRRLPVRVQSLLAQSQIVGKHLEEVKEGKKTVEEIIHSGASLAHRDDGIANNGGIGSSGHIGAGAISRNHKSAPMTLKEVLDFLQSFLKKMNSSNIKNKRANFHGIWAAYHELVVKYLYPWDQEYLRRMTPRREDGSVFLSVASYRDEFCPGTLNEAFSKARNPENLFVGLVQQNCEEKCRSGVLEGGKVEDVGADPDCYTLFCSSNEGKKYCNNDQIRLLKMKETESLGPYMARYFASKMWMGEQWYMQIDSHMTFAQDWDALSIEMLNNAPSDKPVISHYPPPHTADLVEKSKVAAPRLCGPVFATSELEAQIIRLEGSYNYDSVKLSIPRFAPFVAAGYLVAHSDILREVPFDPFLPYIFMGEETILSARLWTSGYDIFSPTISLLGHHYVRNHKPKFWETVHRTFTNGVSAVLSFHRGDIVAYLTDYFSLQVHNPLQMLVLNRVKYQLGYPESAKDMVKPKTLFTAVEQYSMGNVRELDDYLKIVGLNMTTKEVTYTAWCETGMPPPGLEKYDHLYS